MKTVDDLLPVRIGRRITAAVYREQPDPRRALRNDALVAVAVMALSVLVAVQVDPGDGKRPDALGWVLLMCAQAPLVLRRRHTVAALAIMIVFLGPYHALGYAHTAPVIGSMTLLYTVAIRMSPRFTFWTGVVVVSGTVIANWITDAGGAVGTLRVSGWIAAVLVAGVNVRIYRRLVAASVDRAERAEHTRDEVAARRVAEERLRIARDLHDLLAHSITVVGVQASVASHVLAVAPEQFDRDAMGEALSDISQTCRAARREVRQTLEVLRGGGVPDDSGPLPSLDALADLARPAGARLTVTVPEPARVPPAVDAAAYRIVQEALTNTARHAGPEARAEIVVGAGKHILQVRVTDDGTPQNTATDPGFGLIGMRERARSVGGTLTAGPRPEGGFEVVAQLPLSPVPAQEDSV
ncbi:sensor histidine kinase [Streptomyces sp. CA-111067]|uniref:sensor histidine kinase n=1 Tax=Streptomyces sp. CA-111067 TaxID=3240046 RepID=UPI003D973C0C